MTDWKPLLYIPDDVEADDVYINPSKDEVEFRDREIGKIWYRDLEGYTMEKIWDIGDEDPLLAHVLEVMYIEIRAIKEKLIELGEKMEEIKDEV